MENLASETLKGKRLEDASSGAFGIGYVNFGAAVTEGDTVTVSGDTYEFIDAGTVTAGNIEVSVTGDLSAANASDQFAAAVNANANSAVTAIDIDAATIALKTDGVGEWVSLAETFTSGSNTVDAFTNWQSKRLGKFALYVLAPTAAEVTKGSLVFAPDFTPFAVDVTVTTTATGANVAWDGGTTLDVANDLVTLDNGGAVDWAATDTVVVRVYG